MMSDNPWRRIPAAIAAFTVTLLVALMAYYAVDSTREHAWRARATVAAQALSDALLTHLSEGALP
ncbi:MAG: hypothetical protein K6A65_08475, partial [Succinivibrionaceae bacterium]|nr:hypothetical protein [Succinivibrionaceae bacterium]